MSLLDASEWEAFGRLIALDNCPSCGHRAMTHSCGCADEACLCGAGFDEASEVWAS
jgi:hypothetical protein